MTTLPSKTFAQFVASMTSNWAAQLGVNPTLQQGDALYALMETVSSQLIFLQWQIQLVNLIARVQTSTGGDVDSFMQQFGFFRLPSTYAAGDVEFSLASPAGGVVLAPAGTIVTTPGGGIQYQLVADTNQPTWNAALNSYALPIGETSLTATVQALVPGSSSNIAAGMLTQINSNLPFATVTNGAAIDNGLDAEPDSAFRARFVLWLNTLAKGTYWAIVAAIEGTQQGILFNLLDNENTAGAFAPGQFVAVVDDGSGSPPASLINAVQASVNAVRAFTVQAQVIAVSPVVVTINITVRVATGYIAGNIQAAVQVSVVAYIQQTPIGGIDGILVYVSGIESAAMAVPGVISVQPGATLIDGLNADFAGNGFQNAKSTLSNVTVGVY